MSPDLKLIRAVFGVSLLALSACAGNSGGAGKPVTANPDEIVIGVVGPMSGDLRVFGIQMRHGAEMAVKDINASGGVTGKPLRLVSGDDQCDPPRAESRARDLIAQHVVFVDGHFCSGSSIRASSVYHDAAVVQITPSSTNPRLTDDAAAKGWRTVFRTAGRDDAQGDFAGAWFANHYAGRKVAVVDDGSAYGAKVTARLVQVMSAAGLEPSLTAAYRERSSYDDLVEKLIAAKPDAVFIGGFHDDFAKIIRAARAGGVTAEFFGGDALNTSEFWSIAGSAGEGVRFIDAADQVDPASAKTGIKPFQTDGSDPKRFEVTSYAAVQAWAAAANKAGTTDAAKVAEVLHSTAIPTVVGELSWDAKGDRRNPPYAWYVWHSGDFQQAPAN